MMRSFDSLAVRQLRSRPLRATLTAFGVVLGVGMVFGVLLLTGTIRHTFDDIVSSAFGETDLVVSPKTGLLPQATLDRVTATPGVRDGEIVREIAGGDPERVADALRELTLAPHPVGASG